MPHECTTCSRVFADGSKEMLSGCPDCGGNKFQFRPARSGGDGADAGEAASPSAAADRADDAPPEPPEPTTPGGSVAETVAGATERVRSLVGSDDGSTTDDRTWPAVGRETDDGAPRPAGDGPSDVDSDTEIPTTDEDTAQASARSSVVERDELPDPPAPEERRESPEPDDGRGPLEDRDEAPHDAAAETSATTGSSATPERSDAGSEPGSAPFTGNGDRESPDLSDLREELNDQFESIRIVERGQYELNLMELYDREEYIVSLMEDGRYAIEVPETWRDD